MVGRGKMIYKKDTQLPGESSKKFQNTILS